MTTLLAKIRDLKKNPESYREQGEIPGVVYGKDTEPTPISINETELIKALRTEGESSVFTLEVEGATHSVIVQEMAQHPVSGRAQSVDFLAIKKGQKITVDVPVEFIGESPAVKQGIGVLVKVLHEIEVETLPQHLPQHIDVDISKLEKVGDSISVADLGLPAEIEPQIELESTIVTISAQKEEEEEETEEAPDFSQIEVEHKGKKEESDTDAAAEKTEE